MSVIKQKCNIWFWFAVHASEHIELQPVKWNPKPDVDIKHLDLMQK